MNEEEKKNLQLYQMNKTYVDSLMEIYQLSYKDIRCSLIQLEMIPTNKNNSELNMLYRHSIHEIFSLIKYYKDKIELLEQIRKILKC